MRAVMVRKLVYHAIGLTIALLCSIPMLLLWLGFFAKPFAE